MIIGVPFTERVRAVAAHTVVLVNHLQPNRELADILLDQGHSCSPNVQLGGDVTGCNSLIVRPRCTSRRKSSLHLTRHRRDHLRREVVRWVGTLTRRMEALSRERLVWSRRIAPPARRSRPVSAPRGLEPVNASRVGGVSPLLGTAGAGVARSGMDVAGVVGLVVVCPTAVAVSAAGVGVAPGAAPPGAAGVDAVAGVVPDIDIPLPRFDDSVAAVAAVVAGALDGV